MNILVCISHVPDTTAKINFTGDGKALDPNGIQFVINPYDEFGLTKALHLKEAHGGTITVINVGLAATEPTLRKALAIGGDKAVRINANPEDAITVAKDTAHATSEIDGGHATFQAKLPMIVGGKKGLVEEKDLRIPNMRGIMSARTKPLELVEPSVNDGATKALHFEKPAPKAAVKMVDAGNVDELVRLLHEEAKAI